MNWNAVFAFFQQPLLVAVFKVVIIAVIGSLLIRIVNRTVKKILENSKLEKAAHSLIRTLVKTVLYVLLALILASSIGIDVTGSVALASVASLAISLALQNMLANVIGGFTLLYTHPFGAGDYVEIAGQSGTVQEVGIAYTRLTTPDNKLVSIPNSAVVAAEIVNYTVTGSALKLDVEKKVISLNLQIDESMCTMYEYFEIFLGRMMMCRKAAEVLGARFKLTANGSKVL